LTNVLLNCLVSVANGQSLIAVNHFETTGRIHNTDY